jgi:hypothetical protein
LIIAKPDRRYLVGAGLRARNVGPDAKHEIVAHAVIRGKSLREAGLEAGYKDGPGLKGNIARLRHTPAMQERIQELAARCAEQAEVYDLWILEDFKLFARTSLAQFWKLDRHGRPIMRKGKPVLDLSRATPDQLRCIAELTADGRPKLHDPLVALDRLARYRGLLKDKVALTDSSGTSPAVMRVEFVRAQDGRAVPIPQSDCGRM